MDYSAQEIFDILNEQDECTFIEAKTGSENSHSVMETVCSFSNEPDLGGGYLLIGVAMDNSLLFPQYKVVGVNDPDKFQRDFATQCSGMFNTHLRPELTVEKINHKNVIKIWVNEVAPRQKPIYFKTDGLPYGAFRRTGTTDQHCTDDDMHVFYQDASSFDQTPVKGITIADIDENAIKRYRILREKVNPTAEELTYDDLDLLKSLGCINREKKDELNIAGLLLFGSSMTQRSTFPMLRVDYIRVPGNQWIQDPDNRFTTIDMRGPLLLVLYRLIDAINADLPKGFLLPDNDIQAASPGLPLKALREAIVNALMHRSYKEHRPTQVIRYNNRIEIINPGFSLKSEEKLGQPGSETRNPFIAAVFHDTNLAETKGSGVRVMRKLMQEAHLVPPTFESSREDNEFTARLLLHHFLDEKDIAWLQQFEHFNLTDPQKQALIFVREVGAIDNRTYRQMADCDTLKASNELRMLKINGLFSSKGKGKATYYISGKGLNTEPQMLDLAINVFENEDYNTLSTQPTEISTPPTDDLSTPPNDLSTPPDEISTPPNDLNTPPQEIFERITALKKREHNKEKIELIVLDLCNLKPLKASEIAAYFQKEESYFKRKYLSGLIVEKKLKYMYPEMINHPEQAYLTTKQQE